ncbi:hypothetical protein MSG28_007896 [Choristoneura fumiferana]|uniref:Uncharacterized protein n=1 Tax=Choristoneura fumiferana TaxID=7141 RepID=A0ACC0J9D6_CHOFU|nr:hypothetical protein MSG28_007896 [Choristoneura fumiferana]
MHLIQTGGGPSRPKQEDPLHERILCLITPSAVGLHNPYDNDSIITPEENTTESLPGGALVNVIDIIPGPEVQTKHSTGSTAPTAESTAIQDYLLDWGDYTPKSLKTPISKQLRSNPEEKRRHINAGKRLEWMSKRRPQLSSSSVENLQQLKGNAIAIQMEHAAKEREEAKQLFDIQMDIQKEILKQEKIKTRLLLLELRRNKKIK